ncbi:hypothetical protein ACFL0Y_00175 [Patescibacteria group bacterium]
MKELAKKHEGEPEKPIAYPKAVGIIGRECLTYVFPGQEPEGYLEALETLNRESPFKIVITRLGSI